MCRQPGFFLLRFQFCGLIYEPGISYYTWQFCSTTWNRFSSNHFLISSGIFVYCFDKQTFPTLLVFTSHIHTAISPTPNFFLYYYDLVRTFELELFVKCLFLLCYLFILFCLLRALRGLLFRLVLAQS